MVAVGASRDGGLQDMAGKGDGECRTTSAGGNEGGGKKRHRSNSAGKGGGILPEDTVAGSNTKMNGQVVSDVRMGDERNSCGGL